MTKYFATFVSGTQEIVMKQLKKLPLDQLKVSYIEDGLIVFDSTYTPERVIDLRFFNNTFLLLVDFGTKPTNSLEAMTAQLLKQRLPVNEQLIRLTSGQVLRLSAVRENEPTRLEDHHALEQHIIQQLNTGEGNVVQLQLILRRSGKGLLGLKLSRPMYKRLGRPSGALRPELVNIMCLVANVKSKDTVLDPFAGYGTIIDECRQGFHVSKMIAVELDDRLSNRLEQNYPSDQVQIVHCTATSLSFLTDNSVNKVITDPPWGLYGDIKQQELLDLYWQSLSEMTRVLKPGGVLVILSGNADLNKMVEAVKKLDFLKSYNVLVSGKKASILKLRKSDGLTNKATVTKQ